MSYNLEWRDTATLTTTQVTGITDLFYGLTGLTGSKDYEWRAREVDDSTQSDWSAWNGFTTAVAKTPATVYPPVARTRLSSGLAKASAGAAVVVSIAATRAMALSPLVGDEKIEYRCNVDIDGVYCASTHIEGVYCMSIAL